MPAQLNSSEKPVLDCSLHVVASHGELAWVYVNPSTSRRWVVIHTHTQYTCELSLRSHWKMMVNRGSLAAAAQSLQSP